MLKIWLHSYIRDKLSSFTLSLESISKTNIYMLRPLIFFLHRIPWVIKKDLDKWVLS